MNWKELLRDYWPYLWRTTLPFLYFAAVLLWLLFGPHLHRETGLGPESAPLVRTR